MWSLTHLVSTGSLGAIRNRLVILLPDCSWSHVTPPDATFCNPPHQSLLRWYCCQVHKCQYSCLWAKNRGKTTEIPLARQNMRTWEHELFLERSLMWGLPWCGCQLLPGGTVKTCDMSRLHEYFESATSSALLKFEPDGFPVVFCRHFWLAQFRPSWRWVILCLRPYSAAIPEYQKPGIPYRYTVPYTGILYHIMPSYAIVQLVRFKHVQRCSHHFSPTCKLPKKFVPCRRLVALDRSVIFYSHLWEPLERYAP